MTVILINVPDNTKYCDFNKTSSPSFDLILSLSLPSLFLSLSLHTHIHTLTHKHTCIMANEMYRELCVLLSSLKRGDGLFTPFSFLAEMRTYDSTSLSIFLELWGRNSILRMTEQKDRRHLVFSQHGAP